MAPDLRRASAMLLVGLFLSVGCSSASGQGTQASTAAEAVSSGASAVTGQTVAIVCGGPASEQGCAHHPVRATIDVLRMPSRRPVATVHTDGRGHFRLGVAPGNYELRAHTSNQQIRAPVVTVRVLAHQVKHTVITFGPRHPLPIAPGSASG